MPDVGAAGLLALLLLGSRGKTAGEDGSGHGGGHFGIVVIIRRVVGRRVIVASRSGLGGGELGSRKVVPSSVGLKLSDTLAIGGSTTLSFRGTSLGIGTAALLRGGLGSGNASSLLGTLALDLGGVGPGRLGLGGLDHRENLRDHIGLWGLGSRVLVDQGIDVVIMEVGSIEPGQAGSAVVTTELRAKCLNERNVVLFEVALGDPLYCRLVVARDDAVEALLVGAQTTAILLQKDMN